MDLNTDFVLGDIFVQSRLLGIEDGDLEYQKIEG